MSTTQSGIAASAGHDAACPVEAHLGDVPPVVLTSG